MRAWQEPEPFAFSGRFTTLDGAGHLADVDAPEALAEAILAFKEKRT
jgi:pimeloyl-ACP methyl ester carboxylesterase